MASFVGAVAIVTGGASGIGKAIGEENGSASLQPDPKRR
jgi:NAD(P)-dependent dehydrogenase (short-subunit alcohol dehydrogenase family)